MKDEFLNSIPTDTHASVDTRKLIKNIKSLYRVKGTAKAHKAFFKLLFNEPSEVYLPTNDMLRVSDGKFSTQNFIRCTQTTAQAELNSQLLVGQTITQANDPSNDDVSVATAIVENITKFQQGSIEILEVEINSETTTGTFVSGEIVEGVSNLDSDVIVKMTVSAGISATTITDSGSTLAVGDEATISGGGNGEGARIQVLDIQEGGVDEVLINAAGTNYEIGDTITFSSGTAEAKVSVVSGAFAPEEGSIDVHVELETGTITGTGSGDLLLETFADGTEHKFLDSSSQMVDREVKIELENEVGHMLGESDGGTQTSERFYILNQESELDLPYDMEATDHIAEEFNADKIIQEHATGTGDITDIRMIASGSGYTTLPTATITIGDRHLGLENDTNRQRLGLIGELEASKPPTAQIQLETGTGSVVMEEDIGSAGPDRFVQEDFDRGTSLYDSLPGFIEFEQDFGNILDEQESAVSFQSTSTTGLGRIEFEQGGTMLSETFTGASATVIPYGDAIGKATSLNIVEHGINFTAVPTLLFPHYAILKTVSGAITEDETFTTNISGATGTVVDFTAPLLKYTATTSSLEVTDTVTFSDGSTAIVVKSEAVSATTAIDTNIQTSGKFINEDGFVSESSKKIQDSLYYQDYSYVIKVSESINKWRDALKRAVHPSGFYVTGEVNIATLLSGQVRQPVGSTISGGLFSGTSDSPIYMRLNTLFSTVFGRRTGVAHSSSFSSGTQLDGLTKRTRAAANAGYSPEVSTPFTSSHYAARQVDVNLTPETKLELEQRNRNSFYDLRPVIIQDNLIYESATSADQIELENEVGNLVVNFRNEGYTVRDVEVRNGFAYGGPRVKNLSDRAFTSFAANNAITLEGGTGDGEIRLENESGVLQHPQSDSWSTTIADWNTLRFSGTLNSNVDGETMRLSDINGTKSSQNQRINFAFPTEVTKSA